MVHAPPAVRSFCCAAHRFITSLTIYCDCVTFALFHCCGMEAVLHLLDEQMFGKRSSGLGVASSFRFLRVWRHLVNIFEVKV